MKFLVTGGAGFIGSHLSNTLIEQGHQVVVFDDLSTGFFKYLKESNRLTFVCVDISSWESLSKNLNYIKDVDCVFHLAANARIQPSILNPHETNEKNVTGTFNLLEAMRIVNVKNLVFSSSSSCYGSLEKKFLKESDPTSCLNIYSLSKLCGEEYCKTWSSLYGFNTIRLRYFNVYGERSPNKGQYAPVVGLFFRQMLSGENLTIVGDGQQTRDFTYVGDVVDANIKAFQNIEKIKNETFNIGTGNSYKILDLAKETLKVLNLPESRIEFIASRPGEAKHSQANIEKAKKMLNWQPKNNLIKTLKHLCSYYEKQHSNIMLF